MGVPALLQLSTCAGCFITKEKKSLWLARRCKNKQTQMIVGCLPLLLLPPCVMVKILPKQGMSKAPWGDILWTVLRAWKWCCFQRQRCGSHGTTMLEKGLSQFSASAECQMTTKSMCSVLDASNGIIQDVPKCQIQHGAKGGKDGFATCAKVHEKNTSVSCFAFKKVFHT